MERKMIGTPLAAMLGAWTSAQALDVNEQFSVAGTIAGTGQCQQVSGSDGTDTCRGAVPLQLELSYRPNERNEFFAKLGFAAGNGLNPASPWVQAPWAANLEDDVKNINGRQRDYLLAAWYKHTFTLKNESTLDTLFGLLDSTDYLDANEYANDEYTQFMNEAFVNAGNFGLPLFDVGTAVEYGSGPWSINAVGMNIGENDDGNNYNFWGSQLAYRVENSLGVGNYRLTLSGTSSGFPDPTGTTEESIRAWGISFDQELSCSIGAFLRMGWKAKTRLSNTRPSTPAGSVSTVPAGSGSRTTSVSDTFI